MSRIPNTARKEILGVLSIIVRVGKPGTEPYRDGAKELTFLAAKRRSDANHFFGSDRIAAVLEEGNAAVLLGKVRRLEAVLVLEPYKMSITIN